MAKSFEMRSLSSDNRGRNPARGLFKPRRDAPENDIFYEKILTTVFNDLSVAAE